MRVRVVTFKRCHDGHYHAAQQRLTRHRPSERKGEGGMRFNHGLTVTIVFCIFGFLFMTAKWEILNPIQVCVIRVPGAGEW